MCRARTARIVAFWIVIGSIWAPPALSRQKGTGKSISVAEINRSRIIGALGKPLGTIVTVKGQVADSSYTREKAHAGATLLRIQSVNNTRLRREVVFPFAALETVTIKEPAVGTSFNYTGYETGGFVGVPEGAFDYADRFATADHHFRTRFVVVAEARPAR